VVPSELAESARARPEPQPSSSARPLQLALDWRKLLAGAGVALGTAGLIAGGVLASPALAVAGGVGLLAGGSYLAKRAWDQRRENRRRESELAEAQTAIHRGIGGRHRADDTSRTAVLSRILDEASGHLAHRNPRLRPTTGRGELEFSAGPLHDRDYEIRVNPDEPIAGFGRDPAKTRSTVLHELTHVAVDQSYDLNRDRSFGDAPGNFRSDEVPRERARANERDVSALRETLRNDDRIPDEERPFVDARLKYAHANSGSEHDTVVNELLYYFHQKGISEGSETSRGLTRLAHEAHLRRTT
jgi:hypothetical protein